MLRPNWLFGPRHWGAKVVIVVGCALGAQGVWLAQAHRDEAREQTRLYDGVIEAVDASDDAGAIEQAITFLEATGVVEADPRRGQVAGLLDRMVLRRVAALYRSGDREGAEALLERHDALVSTLSS